MNDQAPDDLNVAAELRALAVRLVAVHAADPANAVIAKELRQTLLVIPEDRDEDAELKALFGLMPDDPGFPTPG